MSKLRDKLNQSNQKRHERLNGLYAEINTKLSTWKAEVDEINKELKVTTHPGRKAELESKRATALNLARDYYRQALAQQKQATSDLYDGLTKVSQKDLDTVDIMSIDTASYNVNFLKDVVTYYNSNQISDLVEDLCVEGDAEKLKLVQMYAAIKANGIKEKDDQEYQNIQRAINANRVNELVNQAKPSSRLYTGAHTTIAENEFVDSIYNSNPYARAWEV
ncbi:MAG: hypothetical protein K0S71_650 [Clostridia bacterium]|jgi:hypothetical protein|nr:hypothetical protein [Clostridia bacterium]